MGFDGFVGGSSTEKAWIENFQLYAPENSFLKLTSEAITFLLDVILLLRIRTGSS